MKTVILLRRIIYNHLQLHNSPGIQEQIFTWQFAKPCRLCVNLLIVDRI